MIDNKHLPKIIMAIMAVATALCLLAVSYADGIVSLLGGVGVDMEYETELFDTSEIISINIIMDEDEWEQMLSNAISEEYYVCDVIVNGQRFYNVAIRPKGNTSLSSIAMDPETDRYSLKLEFDHFVDGQTCFGLDKLILNNNYADATNMKEAIIYDMFQFLGADASLYNYASVSLNGEYWGVYLALEGVEDSFMLRTYGTQDGELYKPESMGVGGGGGDSEGGGPGGAPDMDFSNMDFSDFEGMTPPDGGGFPGGGPGGGGPGGGGPGGGGGLGGFPGGGMPDMSDMPGGGGGFSMGGGGANLNYTDDDLDSYSTIWEGEITGTSDTDHRRVVTALQHISGGDNIEEYLDVDNILKYMAVHAFAVNMDSLSGMMAHNYYLYEYNGRLNLIPWDYNLSFGGMIGGSDGATSMVNDDIDDPFQATDFFDSLLENEEYREIYYSYLQQLVDEYVYGGRFDEVYSRIRSQIDSLVESDPTAFYTYDEYVVAVDTLYEVVKLRAESIEGQLSGSETQVDASHIDLTVMGQFDMGFNGDSEEEPDAPAETEQ